MAIGTVLLAVAIVLMLALAVIAAVRRNATLGASEGWPTVPGEIVAIQRRTTMTPNVGASNAAGLPAGSIMSSNTTSRPIVQYADASGQIHKGRALSASGIGRLRVGQSVVVAYDPQLPERAVIRGILAD